jgi:hypothetical protein
MLPFPFEVHGIGQHQTSVSWDAACGK